MLFGGLSPVLCLFLFPSQRATPAFLDLAIYSVLFKDDILQRNFPLSSRAREPKCRAENHHTVLSTTSGLLAPYSPVSNSFSSSSYVSARVAYGLFLLPASFTWFFRFAARTFLDFSNSLSLRMLIFNAVVSVRCLCILLWIPESVSGSYSSPFTFLTSIKNLHNKWSNSAAGKLSILSLPHLIDSK